MSIICSFFFSFLFIKQELFFLGGFFVVFFTFSLIVLWIRLICCHQKPVVFSGAFTLQMKVSVGGRWCRTSCQNKQKTNKHNNNFSLQEVVAGYHYTLCFAPAVFTISVLCCCLCCCAFDSKHLSASQCWLFDLACCASVHKAEQRLCFFFFFSFFEIFKDDQSADVLSHVGLLLWFYIG